MQYLTDYIDLFDLNYKAIYSKQKKIKSHKLWLHAQLKWLQNRSQQVFKYFNFDMFLFFYLQRDVVKLQLKTSSANFRTTQKLTPNITYEPLLISFRIVE